MGDRLIIDVPALRKKDTKRKSKFPARSVGAKAGQDFRNDRQSTDAFTSMTKRNQERSQRKTPAQRKTDDAMDRTHVRDLEKIRKFAADRTGV